SVGVIELTPVRAARRGRAPAATSSRRARAASAVAPRRSARSSAFERTTRRSALERAAKPRAAQERALEDEEADDGHETGDEHRRQEDAELRLRLDRRQAHRERLLVRIREDEQRPEE